jgi:hypothetical protein
VRLGEAPPEVVTTDRRQTFTLAAALAEGVLNFTCQVEEWTLPLSIAGLNNVRLELQAELVLNDVLPASVGVVIDSQPPTLRPPVRIESLSGRRLDRLPANPATPTVLCFRVDDLVSDGDQELAGVERVLVLLKGADPPFAPLAEKLPCTFDAGRGCWTLTFKPGDLQMKLGGRYLADVTAIDRLGNAQDFESAATLNVDVPKPPPKKKKADEPPPVGTITGVTRLGTRTFKGASIQLVELNKTTKSGDGGKFSFEGIPAGAYTLKATATAQGLPRKGEASGVAPVMPGGDPMEVEITLSAE